MSRPNQTVKESVCYVQAERAFSANERADYRYSVYVKGDFVICDASADEMRQLAAAINQALSETAEKGGGQ